MPRVGARTATFTESVIREMTRLCLEHGGINLAQGFPDFPCPPELKAAAKAAIDGDVNQYAITWGAKVFSRDELTVISELCQQWDTWVFTDEIYEHIQYQGPGGHVPPATVPGLEDRTVTVNAMSKTYAVTGWRVGWTIASPAATAAIRKVHDFLTVGAAAPLQEAGVAALGLPPSYYDQLATEYRERR